MTTLLTDRCPWHANLALPVKARARLMAKGTSDRPLGVLATVFISSWDPSKMPQTADSVPFPST
jgi:hypothetical protein